MESHLIDQIYERAFIPDQWPIVLDQLARLADARGSHLFTATTRVRHWAASATLANGMAQVAHTDSVIGGQRWARLRRAQHAGFLTEHGLYTDEELSADPLYRDFLWPAGVGCLESRRITDRRYLRSHR